MSQRRIDPKVSWLSAMAFSFAALIYLWKLIGEGFSVRNLILAGGFTIAAVVWLAISIGPRGGDGDTDGPRA